MRMKNGYTFIEVMISLGIAVVGILVAVGLISYGHRSFFTMQSNINSETSLDRIMYLMRMNSWLALNVRYAPGNLDGTANNSGEGYVAPFKYDRFSDLATPTRTLMYFNREDSPSNTATTGLDSAAKPTAIFFRAPTPQTAGALIFSSAAPGSPEVDLSPSLNTNDVLDGVVGVTLSDAKFDPTSMLLDSIVLSVTVRIFLPDTENRRWCPEADAASAQCQGTKNFHDVTQEVVLSFNDNRRNSLRSDFEYPFGVYFFKPVSGK